MTTALALLVFVLAASVTVGLGALCVIVLFATFKLAADGARRQAEARRARDAALGLRREGLDLVGVVDDRGVRISFRQETSGKTTSTWWTTHVAVPEVRGHVELVPVGAFESGGRATGDAAFDAASRVRAGFPLALAWLDEHTRSILGPWHAGLRDGVLYVTATSEPMEGRIRTLVDVANRMAAVEPATSLAQIATTDAPKVRVRALEVLAGLDRARAAEVARGAARSEWVEERALGLVLAGDRRALVDRIGRGPDEDRHELLEVLARFGTAALVAAAVDALPTAPLARPIWFVTTAAVAAHPSRAALDAVLHRWPGQLAADGEFAADRLLVAATALDDPDLEGAVTLALGSARQEAERGLRWLAERGTVASVPAIDALLADTWPLTELRNEATAAKRAIQSRATGARGGLSEAEASTGGLTEVEGAADAARRGRLALRQ